VKRVFDIIDLHYAIEGLVRFQDKKERRPKRRLRWFAGTDRCSWEPSPTR